MLVATKCCFINIFPAGETSQYLKDDHSTHYDDMIFSQQATDLHSTLKHLNCCAMQTFTVTCPFAPSSRDKTFHPWLPFMVPPLPPLVSLLKLNQVNTSCFICFQHVVPASIGKCISGQQDQMNHFVSIFLVTAMATAFSSQFLKARLALSVIISSISAFCHCHLDLRPFLNRWLPLSLIDGPIKTPAYHPEFSLDNVSIYCVIVACNEWPCGVLKVERLHMATHCLLTKTLIKCMMFYLQ